MSGEISIPGLIQHATFVVQLVMLVLCLLSVVSLYLAYNRHSLIKRAKKSSVAFEDRFWSGVDLSRLFIQVNNEPNITCGQENVFRAGFKEFARLRKNDAADPDSVMQGSERAMRVALLREQEKLEAGLPILATIGSVSPYIGLFGTVWGIMNSFLALASQQQATLSAVAPGIAEALIATAMGLVAAVPAVIAYNHFTSQVDRLLHSYDAFSDEFSGILHRKAHASSEPAQNNNERT
ncbi:MAG: protein TolQ [Gammaproteobacteria bacterium]|nr:MAG: protein TolQ [Gammaproteobacteria bacterium]